MRPQVDVISDVYSLRIQKLVTVKVNEVRQCVNDPTLGAPADVIKIVMR